MYLETSLKLFIQHGHIDSYQPNIIIFISLLLCSRPDTSFMWFLNPLKTLKYILWRNFKFKILKLLIFLFFVLMIVLFFYAMPDATVNAIFGALWSCFLPLKLYFGVFFCILYMLVLQLEIKSTLSGNTQNVSRSIDLYLNGHPNQSATIL